MVLPTGYTRLQYVTGSANAYTIVPIHLTDEDVVKAKLETRASCNLFGCYTGTSATDNFSLYAGSNYYIRVDGQLNSSVTATKNTVVEYELSKDGLLEDGVQVASFSGVGSFTTSTYFYVGWLDNASSAKFTGDIYSIEVVGKFNGIPAKRDSDGVAGFYDTVTSTFYASSGSAWTAGPEAQKPAPFWLLMRRRAMMPQTTITTLPPGWDGKIWAYYNVTDTTTPTTLLYTTGYLSGMNVDGVDVTLATTYQFSTTGEHLVKFSTSYTSIAARNFEGATALLRCYLPSRITALNQRAFFGCTGMVYINLENITTLSGTSHFYWANMSEVDVSMPLLTSPGGGSNFSDNYIRSIIDLGSITQIPAAYFSSSRASKIIVPASVTSLEGYSFYHQAAGVVIVFLPTTPPTVNGVRNFMDFPATGKIYVPYSADHSILAAYQATTQFDAISSQIYELTEAGEIPE